MLLIQTDFWYIEQLRYSHASQILIAIGSKRTGTDNRPKMVKAFDPRAMAPDPDHWFEFPATALIAFDPSGQYGAVAKRVWDDDYIYFIHFDERKPVFESRSISVSSPNLLALAIPADGKRIFGLIRLPREIEFWRLIRTWSTITEKTLDETTVVTDGEQLICSTTGLFVAVDANSGRALTLVRTSSNAEMQLAGGDAFRFTFSPSGKFLASGGQFIRCWTTRSGKLISHFRGQDEDIPDLAFSPDERLLAVARTDGPVEFWDFREARLVRSYSWNIGRLSAIAIAPDGLTCAVAGEQGRIVIFDLDDL